MSYRHVVVDVDVDDDDDDDGDDDDGKASRYYRQLSLEHILLTSVPSSLSSS